jgi:hypothetical protein
MELSEVDLNAARATFRTRNVEACKRGLPACDPSLLTGPEMAMVTTAYQQRRSLKRPAQSKP